jgi:Ca-activated chloride channel family protein
MSPAPPAPPQGRNAPYQDVGRDKFTTLAENAFKVVREEPVSTFSIDVDTASYSWVRSSLSQNVLPQPASVRTEELVNYFTYDYARPRSAAEPFTTNIAVFPSPWSAGRKIVRIGIKGFAVQRSTRPAANLVFLIDTSGSMNAPNKLPLVQRSLNLLLEQLDKRDTVSIVTYAGSAGTALEPTSARQKDKIRAVIDGLGSRRQHCRERGNTAGLHACEGQLRSEGR